VKPGNLLMAQETHITKLADFGIAKAAEQTRITQVGAVLGTAAYLSPEQALGEEAGPASDIYSLGVCAYQFLTGRLPHEYSSLTELALKQQREHVEPLLAMRPEVPRELDAAIRLCLERDPAARYPSALLLAEALEAGLHGETTDATRAMSLGEQDAADALDDTSSTRPLPRTSYRPPTRRPRASAPPPTAPPARRDSRDARRAARRRATASFAALLLVVAAIVAVGLAVLASGGDDVVPVQENDVQEQLDGVRDFIREHSS
jgi:serine/threonine-protein kinase